MAAGEDARSLGELFAELARETSDLVRQELRQAGIEMSQRVSGVGRHAGLLVGGAVVAHAAFLALVAAIILALGEIGLPWWLAALIVAVVLAGIGAMLVQRASTAIKHADVLPRRTMEQVKEDQEWIKQQVS
jgi:predicted phage tail protein